jgi:CBS domain-containing protein
MAMKARDVMTPRVISIEADAAITQAMHLLLQNRISGLPVIDREGELVGLTGDFIRRGEIGTQRHRSCWLEFLIGPGRLADEYVHARGRKMMTRQVFTVTENTPLDELVRLMERHRIKRVLVLRGGQLVGIVTRAILCMHW